MTKNVATDGQEISWQYTIVLRNVSGRRIRLAKHRRSFQHQNLVPLAHESPFERQLDANAELRVPWVFREHPIDATQGVVQRGGGIQAWHRFEGSDDRGEAVVIDVRFELD